MLLTACCDGPGNRAHAFKPANQADGSGKAERGAGGSSSSSGAGPPPGAGHAGAAGFAGCPEAARGAKSHRAISAHEDCPEQTVEARVSCIILES